MNTNRKYFLASKLYRQYTGIARQRYNAEGCNSRNYKLYSKIAAMCANILHKNGWTGWL